MDSVLLLLIDNYDSFTYNLAHMLGELQIEVKVIRNDEITTSGVHNLKPTHIVISPGPGSPNNAGICLDLITSIKDYRIPLLGVCLGHQSIGQAFGGKIVKAKTIMHGKVDKIYHENAGIFKSLPSPFDATRYHSLVVDPGTVPQELQITAKTDCGTIMGLQHTNLPVFGVQFHPESIASQSGVPLLQKFLNSSRSHD